MTSATKRPPTKPRTSRAVAGCGLAGLLSIAMLLPLVFFLGRIIAGRSPTDPTRVPPGIPPPSKDAVAWPICDGAFTPPAGVSATWRGAEEFEKALEEQDATGAPLLIYVRTDWCQYCAAFDRVLRDRGLSEYLASRIVKVRINPEKGDAAARLSALLGVKGYPSLFLISPRRMVTEVRWEESPAEFQLELQRFVEWQRDHACWEKQNRGGP